MYFLHTIIIYSWRIFIRLQYKLRIIIQLCRHFLYKQNKAMPRHSSAKQQCVKQAVPRTLFFKFDRLQTVSKLCPRGKKKAIAFWTPAWVSMEEWKDIHTKADLVKARDKHGNPTAYKYCFKDKKKGYYRVQIRKRILGEPKSLHSANCKTLEEAGENAFNFIKENMIDEAEIITPEKKKPPPTPNALKKSGTPQHSQHSRTIIQKYCRKCPKGKGICNCPAEKTLAPCRRAPNRNGCLFASARARWRLWSRGSCPANGNEEGIPVVDAVIAVVDDDVEEKSKSTVKRKVKETKAIVKKTCPILRVAENPRQSTTLGSEPRAPNRCPNRWLRKASSESVVAQIPFGQDTTQVRLRKKQCTGHILLWEFLCESVWLVWLRETVYDRYKNCTKVRLHGFQNGFKTVSTRLCREKRLLSAQPAWRNGRTYIPRKTWWQQETSTATQ